jgi:hypothetical protein
MATSFEHRALVEQLRSLHQKRAENPGEQALNTSHPSGSDSASDDHTSPAVVGHRYAENSADNDAMYPKGTDSDVKNEAGSEEKDPGNNKGLHPRPSGDAPEVEKDYNLNDHNDPGSSHPSAKAAAAFAKEAKALAAELRKLVKAAAADSYVSGEAAEEATDDTKTNAKGTMEYPVNTENDGNIPLTEDQGKNAGHLEAIRKAATLECIALRDNMKAAAELDAESFVQTVSAVMNSFAAPYAAAQQKQAAALQAEEVAIKIAMYDMLAERDGLPKFAEASEANSYKQAAARQAEEIAIKIAMYDMLAERDGLPKFAEAHMDKSDDAELAAKYPPKDKVTRGDVIAAAKANKKEASRKGGRFRKVAEDEECETSSEEEVADDEEMAAEEILADMASMPAGGGAPDEEAMMMGMDPAMLAEEGGEAPLSPEEEMALMALLEQEGMKESDVKSFAKVASLISNGKINPSSLSRTQVEYLTACDNAVKRAGANFQTLRSASRVRNELNSIYRGNKS